MKKPPICRPKASYSSNNLYTTVYQMYGMASVEGLGSSGVR